MSSQVISCGQIQFTVGRLNREAVHWFIDEADEFAP